MRLVRDLFGRSRLAVEHRIEQLDAVDAALAGTLGTYFAGPSLVADEMVAPHVVFGVDAGELLLVDGIEVIARVLLGADWTRGPLPNAPPRPQRATLYGLKGGVGRSTAIVAWSQHLAMLGERVLVIDLDLESPGVSSSLLPPDSTSFGVVDWLVEDAVGQADDELLRLMVGSSPLARGDGDVLVVPCGGSTDARYLAKLSRAYLEVPRGDGPRPLATRIATLVDELERTVNPTVVLFDSGAGLHDLAGISTTRLGALTFLFAMDTSQTWAGYRTLLSGWGSRPAIAREVRERLRVVAAQVPETNRGSCLEHLRLAAYDAFEPLYDRPPPEGEKEPAGVFNPDIQATDAPHAPLPIYWSGEFQNGDPLTGDVTDDQLRAAFGAFVDVATELLLAERITE
ncbi:MAG: hypothetical protein EXR72_04310 [Myxococcales bacterium]|nr:hypothetical protein [Myxococcales bacterium]